MKIPLMCIATIVLLCTFAAAQTPQADTASHDVNLTNVAKIKVGSTTREQIKDLLGPPYRMTNYADCSPMDYQEFWEYVGHDQNGIFKIHIEFDDDGIARIIGKDTKKGPIIVLDAAPKPDKQHHHVTVGG
ncbi:MAG: outer membrane protein assembly factor BamE [Terriglobales bacterium]